MVNVLIILQTLVVKISDVLSVWVTRRQLFRDLGRKGSILCNSKYLYLKSDAFSESAKTSHLLQLGWLNFSPPFYNILALTDRCNSLYLTEHLKGNIDLKHLRAKHDLETYMDITLWLCKEFFLACWRQQLASKSALLYKCGRLWCLERVTCWVAFTFLATPHSNHHEVFDCLLYFLPEKFIGVRSVYPILNFGSNNQRFHRLQYVRSSSNRPVHDSCDDSEQDLTISER